MKSTYSIPLIGLLLVGCNFGTITGPEPTVAQGQPPRANTKKSCGDGICDGPENPGICPQDCTSNTTVVPSTASSSQGGAKTGQLTAGPRGNTYWMANPSSGARLFLVVTYPNDGVTSLLPTIVLIPGGLGAQDLENDVGQDADAFAAAGFAVLQFDADGRGQSEGEEDYNGFIHQDGLAAIILAAGQIPRVDTSQIGVLSRSYGVTMAAGALGRNPDIPVRFFIDWEGPADRYYTTGDCQNHPEGIAWPSCQDDTFWSEREAVSFIGRVHVPYQRIQSVKDHVQKTNSHAVAMINAAVSGGVPWVRLNDYPISQTYNPSNPPEMFPDAIDRNLASLFVRYAQELLKLEF